MKQLSAVSRFANREVNVAFDELQSSETGLTSIEAARRLEANGRNELTNHRVTATQVLLRQLKNPILILLAVTAGISFYLSDPANAVVIFAILVLSVGLGFFSEYRAERAAAALHDQIPRRASVLRDGGLVLVNVEELVVGDVVQLTPGAIVPADMRVIESFTLECDESVISGESVPVTKSATPAKHNLELTDLTSSLLMGTIVRSGSGKGVVVAVGKATEFGQIAAGLSTETPQTQFQLGLRRFSMFLLWVALALTSLIFIGNLLLGRPIIDSLLFSLAIAIGMTPQLLPAVVSTGLSRGSKQLAMRGVLVKRLISIEDLGDMDVLVTDKTGTLTNGTVTFRGAQTNGNEELVKLYGLMATDAKYSEALKSSEGLNAIDAALWQALPEVAQHTINFERMALQAFDSVRMCSTVLVRDSQNQLLQITKGAPEAVFKLCKDASALEQAKQLYDQGLRVIAVATRAGSDQIVEADLEFAGFLIFEDPLKPDVRESLEKLKKLGIEVKIATGDSAIVAERVCREVGLDVLGTLTGAEMEELDDEALSQRVQSATVFARFSPEQKARLIRVIRSQGRSVGFMGDGVNDALSLHEADVGVSVDTASDVAKDAADAVLLKKDLGVLAEGISQGRRVFTNTMKYILMGTSGDFGNMFSAAIGSVTLGFMPMLPGQVLLNDLLYDSSQLALAGDRVDEEQLRKPSQWNIKQIRRFMFIFGPASSLFDFATFALMLFVFHASEAEFQAGWFVESLATETLIVFAVRTRRIPFYLSRPSKSLTLSVLAIVAIGCYLPYSPLSNELGFTPLPTLFFMALVGMILLYLLLVEFLKKRFFRLIFGQAS